MSPKLVIGGNGFLGSHVTRQLVAAGEEVRVTVREGANTAGIEDLDVNRFVGDIFDTDMLRRAIAGCDVVYYCVVDARAWLRDPAPLFRTNVVGLRGVLDVACEAPLKKFVFTSSYVTVGRPAGRPATEDDQVNRSQLGNYARSRVEAEDLVMQYVRERGLPAVAMCVSTTYGGGDHGPTPQGALIAAAAYGRLSFVLNKVALEAVGIDDAARSMILAADRGRAGERYLISQRMISNVEVVQIAASEAGLPVPEQRVSIPMLYAIGALGSLKSALRGSDERLTLESVRLMRSEAEVDCARATRELGWQPRPVEESVREAARFWIDMRTQRRKARREG